MTDDLHDLAARLDARLKLSDAERIDNAGWHTASDFAEVWGISRKRAGDRLSRAVRAGIMVCERRPLVRTDGVIQRYTMYREAGDVTAD